jgi:ABC-type lipoprotein export system ATPase subunit
MGGKIMDVLKGITGTVPAQTFSVVLGPSGAGKSSLFDVLLGVAEGVVFRGCAHQPQPLMHLYWHELPRLHRRTGFLLEPSAFAAAERMRDAGRDDDAPSDACRP